MELRVPTTLHPGCSGVLLGRAGRHKGIERVQQIVPILLFKKQYITNWIILACDYFINKILMMQCDNKSKAEFEEKC